MEIAEYFKIAADLIIIPMFGMIWGIQGRISKLEAYIELLLERRQHQRKDLNRE